MRVYFYPSKPKQIPKTHLYRPISFEEFELLIGQVQEPLIVQGDHQRFVLSKLLGVKSQIYHTKVDERFPLAPLGELDSAVVIDHYGVSTFGGWISPQDKVEILARTRFGVIEPRSFLN